MACRCCGIPTTEKRCLICRQICEARHGDDLQMQIVRRIACGAMTLWHGVAASMLDDALITGKLLVIPPEPGERGAGLWVAAPVPRWLVVAKRALARGEMVAIGDVVQAAIAPYIGLDNRAAVRASLKADLLEAMMFIDSDIVEIEIDVQRDAIDPELLQIIIKKSVNVEPGAVVVNGDVELPPELLARKRAKA